MKRKLRSIEKQKNFNVRVIKSTQCWCYEQLLALSEFRTRTSPYSDQGTEQWVLLLEPQGSKSTMVLEGLGESRGCWGPIAGFSENIKSEGL